MNKEFLDYLETRLNNTGNKILDAPRIIGSMFDDKTDKLKLEMEKRTVEITKKMLLEAFEILCELKENTP